MRIAVTGHRPNKLGNEYSMEGPISDYLTYEFEKILIEYAPKIAVSGMALGVDQIWAIAALHKGINVIAAIPFIGQELAWSEESQWMYQQILLHKRVTPTYICDPGYAAWKMQKRNEWMVDHSTFLVAAWDGSPGGTSNCVKYAQKQGKKIIRIDLKQK